MKKYTSLKVSKFEFHDFLLINERIGDYGNVLKPTSMILIDTHEMKIGSCTHINVYHGRGYGDTSTHNLLGLFSPSSFLRNMLAV